MGDDNVIVGEDAVREPVVADELPDVVDRVQLWHPRRWKERGDVGWNFELGRRVPSGMVEDDNGRPFKMTPAKLRLAQAAMGKPETIVAELCAELGIICQTLYRHVTPRGEFMPDGKSCWRG